MSDTLEPLVQECSACGTLIDVSDEEPLALMHCPTCGAAMRVRRVFGSFELLEVLGAGGMGAVYRAQDISLNRSVALKLLRREYSEHPDFIQQFAHEASITAHINHPNVVKVFSTGSDHGLFYIAMELVDKGSLDDLMTLQGRVGESQVLEVGIQAAQGLRAAFQRGLMHRDIKPGNILFADAHHAKIVDFGLAAPLGGDSGGEVWGTPYYVAPEKLDSPPQEDFRSDIYSLGATLFHAIAGRAPYEAEDASMVALKHLKSQSVNLQTYAPDVSSSTAYVINKAMHKDANQRYQSYDELIQHLEYARNQLLQAKTGPVAVKAGGARVQAAARPKPRVVMEPRGQQSAMSVITIFMLIALGVGGYFLYENRERFFPKKAVKKVKVDKNQGQAEYRSRYEAARKQLIAGQAEEAAVVFQALEAEQPSGAQPLLNWITFHTGLAKVFAGKLDDAKPDFDKLAKRGAYSRDPFEMKFAEFLTKVSTLMVDENAPAPDLAKDYDKATYEAMGLLALAAKNWEMGEFENAVALFRQFESSNPEPPDTWIFDYRAIATAYEESYDKYKEFAEKIKNVGEPAKAKAEIPKLKEELTTLKLKGQLAKKGRSLMRKAEQDITDFEDEQKKAVMEMESSDAQVLAETKTKADPSTLEFKFKDAVIVAKGAQVITDKGKADKKGLVKRYDWLAGFKSTLTSDLGTYPYNGGVLRKAGVPVAGVVADADDKNLKVKVGAGEVLVPWTEASYEGLVAIARSMVRTDLPADRLADRLWYLGVYSEFSGKIPEASKYFDEAVKRKAEYADEWKLFPNVPKP